MDWFYIALLSPALFALVNIIDDNLLRSVYKSPFFGAIISGLFATLPLLSLFFFPLTISSPLILVFGLAAGFLTTVYYLFYFKALGVEFPSVVIALFSLTPAIVSLLAYFLLGESLMQNQYIGFVLILGGSFAISAIDVKKYKFSKALYPILIASVLYAIIAILQKGVYENVDFYSGYMYFATGMGLGALFFMAFFKEGKKFVQQFNTRFKKWIFIFVLVELIGIVAEFSMNLAISLGPVSLVKVVEGVQPMYVLIFAILFYRLFPNYLREALAGDRIKKILCMLTMLIGLYFVNQ